MTRPDTDFGFETVHTADKARRVAKVFTAVAGNYDRMNDLMSFGLHRLWKAFAVERTGVRPGDRVLDVAAGSGDLAVALARRVGDQGEVWLTDINGSMLALGRDRVLDNGLCLPVAQCDAEALPFPDSYFHCVTVGFGLRNMTHKDRALTEMRRVLRPGGRLVVLEFSRVWRPLAPLYDQYSFQVLPWLGKVVAKNAASYRYLAESIRMHPGQEELKVLMEQIGLEDVEYWNLTAGVAAVHRGVKYE